jgi:hypothetical protein
MRSVVPHEELIQSAIGAPGDGGRLAILDSGLLRMVSPERLDGPSRYLAARLDPSHHGGALIRVPGGF